MCLLSDVLAVTRLIEASDGRLGLQPPSWALTGSSSLAVRGVPLRPNDIDIFVTWDAFSKLVSHSSVYVVQPPIPRASQAIIALYAMAMYNGVYIDLLVDAVIDLEGNGWSSMDDWRKCIDVFETSHGRVLLTSLSLERRLCEVAGKTERLKMIDVHLRQVRDCGQSDG
jgi:hypothetical protein